MVLAIPFPNIDPVIFEIGGLELRWYAVAYMLGLAFGWLYVARLFGLERLWAHGRPPMRPQESDILLLWMAGGVVLGGRLGFVLFYDTELLWPEPWRALMIWKGGMAFHGGMIGVAVAILLLARVTRVSALSVGDAVAAATPIGLFFGRLANFINGELWGRVTDQSWGMVFPQVEAYAQDYPWLLTDGQNLPRHPSQLYEAALEGLVLFAVIAYFVFRRGALKKPGFTAGLFLIGYGSARFFVEFFRQWNPDLGFDFYIFGEGISRGQTLCLPMIAAGVAFIVYAQRRGVPEAEQRA